MKLKRLAVCSLALSGPLLSLACSDDAGQPEWIGSAGSARAATAGSSSAGNTGGGGSATGGTGSGTAGSSMGGSSGNSNGGSSNGGSSAGASGQNTAGGGNGPGGGGIGSGGGGGGGTPTDGAGLYALNCSSCHGEQGRGGLLGPEIQHPIREYSTWVVRNGRPQDARYPKPMEKVSTERLSDAQLTLILDYLDTPPQPTTGQGLYQDYCLNCHGADGKSEPAKHDITAKINELAMDVRMGHHPGEFSKRDGYMPAFTTTRLSDAQIALIKTYVESL